MKQNDTLNKQETGNTPAARWSKYVVSWWSWTFPIPHPTGTTAEVAEEEGHPTPPRTIGTTAEVAEEEGHPTPPPAESAQPQIPAPEAHPADSKTSEEWYQMYITAVNEAKNVNQSTERDIQAAKQFAIQKFAFGVFDTRRSLQDAIAASELDEEAPAMVGLKITLKGLEKTLHNNGVTFVAPAQGDDFDADMHEIVGMEHTEGEKDNTIAIMLQEGFSLNGRLVRPAIVKIYQTSLPSETGN